ncbi:MAG TPA: tetratricopeptide repeat protein [Asticcacaulis sp.]|nr:tetratricopeptide repeat protein [Asticcacaulis sp.]
MSTKPKGLSIALKATSDGRLEPLADARPGLSLGARPKADTALPFQGFVPQAPARQIMGDSGSSEALRILAEANEHIRKTDMLNLLRDAVEKFRIGEWGAGGELALKALHIDEECAEAWHILGVARDKCGDFTTALTCYDAALKLQPDNIAIASDLGRLAYRMGHNDMAEKFFRFHLGQCPDSIEAVNNLATTLRELSKNEEAIALLQDAIPRHPQDPQLWNVLGTVMNTMGDIPSAQLFYREALRFDPNHVHALYNLGGTEVCEESVALLERALPMFDDPLHQHTCKLSLAFVNLGLGRLEKGWEWYVGRSRHAGNETVHYVIPRPRWQPGEAVAGRRLFVSAEQGLGDEILFANLLGDLRREIGPHGHLAVGVEPRLVPLFRRSFPDIEVVRHHTTKHEGRTVRIFPDIDDWSRFDAWTIMGDFLSRYRSHVEDFPTDGGYLTPDPERVAHWRRVLDELNAKPKIGLLWKSLIRHARRDRFYSPFADWEPILKLDELQFVNLQYGDVSEELEMARAAGIDIWTPPGIDLKNDLDDVAALCVALDAVVSPQVATANIAGASGAHVFLMLPLLSWTALGTQRFPWYPTVRCFFTETFTDWAPVVQAVADALRAAYPAETTT